MVPKAHLIKKIHNGSHMLKIIAIIWRAFWKCRFLGPDPANVFSRGGAVSKILHF